MPLRIFSNYVLVVSWLWTNCLTCSLFQTDLKRNVCPPTWNCIVKILESFSIWSVSSITFLFCFCLLKKYYCENFFSGSRVHFFCFEIQFADLSSCKRVMTTYLYVPSHKMLILNRPSGHLPEAS